MSTFSIELNAGMLPRMDIYEIRKQQLVKLIGKQKKVTCAERWGISPAHLSQILSDKTAKNLGDDVARRIEATEGLPRGWFDSIWVAPELALASPPEDGPALSAADQVKQMLSKVKGLSSDARERIVAAAGAPSNVVTADFSRPGLVGDEIRIAHYDIRGAMGDGQKTADFPEMLKDISVSQKHLRELGVEYDDYNYLKLVTGWGQSMEPTIKHRDPLIVDISIREFVGDGIYLYSWDDLVYIKRVQLADAETFEILSDNPRHPPRKIRRDDTHILARVLLVWNAHLV